jgi:two-component system, NarL family, nitrate/nitrite response regulator NarL
MRAEGEHGVGGGARCTVVAADDHPLFRAALRQAIEESAKLELLELAADGVEALAALRRCRPDVAVLDVRMPGLGGPEVLKQALASDLDVRVLFISEYNDAETVLSCLLEGGQGYLPKTATAEQICASIERVASGEAVLPEDLGTGLASAIRRHGWSDVRLSERERTVLDLIAQGASVRAIAEQLHLAQPTIKTHVQHVYTKLGVHNRGAAVAEAMRRGLLE